MIFRRGVIISAVVVTVFGSATGGAVALAGTSGASGGKTPDVAVRAVACARNLKIRGCPAKPLQAQSCVNWSACPVTSRLRRRLAKVGAGPGGGGCDCQPVIRAQFAPLSVRFAKTQKQGARASTLVVYDMGHVYGLSRETFVTVHQSGGWLVADIYCTGKPATTIYNSPLKPCYREPK